MPWFYFMCLHISTSCISFVSGISVYDDISLRSKGKTWHLIASCQSASKLHVCKSLAGVLTSTSSCFIINCSYLFILAIYSSCVRETKSPRNNIFTQVQIRSKCPENGSFVVLILFIGKIAVRVGGYKVQNRLQMGNCHELAENCPYTFQCSSLDKTMS